MEQKTYFHDGGLTMPPYEPGHKGKPVKVPRELGEAIDLLYHLNSERKGLQRQVDVIDEAEKALKNHLIEAVSKQSLDGAVGKVAKIKIIYETVGTIKDFMALFEYMRKTKNPALLQRRLSQEAVKEIWAGKKAIPGVEAFQVVKLSLTKA